MIGMTLSNRYKLLEKIGEGGMALVFKAKDSLLGRTVAVKVLRPQFASDDEFVERFRREAKSAASLSHPNVVNIYDVGQDEQTYFIVMEYVDGVNLKNLIRDKAPLPAIEVVSIARQIVEALEHAHSNDIVHRDIKPHNILVTKEGRVKVTDFGIARAASRSSLTQTGMVLGSVHYFSPEQARGTSAGIQSDLYSVGVVIYEMITGTVPFKGDTPISVALAHIQDEVPPARSLNPGVPPGLERVLDKALAKSLDTRYDTASSMLRDLYIAGAQAHEMTLADIEATRAISVPKVPADVDAVVDEPTLIRGKRNSEASRKRPKHGRLVTVMASVLGLLVIMLVLGLGVRSLLFGQPEVEVPKLEGMSYHSAVVQSEKLGLVVEGVGDAFNSRIPAEHVISQQPPSGRIVKKGRHILVVVSKGSERVKVPNVVGMKAEEAAGVLKDVALTVGATEVAFSTEVEEGAVSSQNPPADTQVDKDSVVDLVVSKGTEPIKIPVPNLIGLPLEEALSVLSDMGLVKGKVKTELNVDVDPDVVLEQMPEAESQVDKGQSVNLIVSSSQDGLATDNIPVDEPRRFAVNAKVPDGPAQQEVKIIVTDVMGTRTVYKRFHNPGDVVSQDVEARSPGTIEVYLAGQLAKRQTI